MSEHGQLADMGVVFEDEVAVVGEHLLDTGGAERRSACDFREQ